MSWNAGIFRHTIVVALNYCGIDGVVQPTHPQISMPFERTKRQNFGDQTTRNLAGLYKHKKGFVTFIANPFCDQMYVVPENKN